MNDPDHSPPVPPPPALPFDAFKELAVRYPNGKYAKEATVRMNYLVNALAQSEVGEVMGDDGSVPDDIGRRGWDAGHRDSFAPSPAGHGPRH